MLSAGLQRQTRFGNSLMLAFSQAGVAVGAGISWKLGPTTHGINCWGSLSVVNWEWEGRNNGDQYSLSFYV